VWGWGDKQTSLVSVAFVYFAGGVVVQKFYFKREGLEIIPNSEFWLALPGLVKVLSLSLFPRPLLPPRHFTSSVGLFHSKNLTMWRGHTRTVMCSCSTTPGGCAAEATSRSRATQAVLAGLPHTYP
jgi:hypothetical protein